jgi:signal transduction histidine kinase
MYRSFTRYLLLLCMSVWLTACGPASTPAEMSLVDSAQWHMDDTGQESWQDAENAHDWQPLPEWKTWGFGEETVWMRLQLSAAAQGSSTPWVVRVRPPVLDYVTLYDPTSGLVLRTGDAIAPTSDDLSSIHFSMQIPALPHARTVYLQVRSTSARSVHVEVLPYGQAQQKNRLQEWVVGFIGSASAIFAVWALAQWWGTREKVILAFAVKQLIATLYAFFFMGFARIVIGPMLSEGVLTLMASTIFIWTVSVTVWFFSLLIEGYHPSKWALRACRVLVILIALLPALLPIHPHLILSLGNISALASFALLLFTLATAIPQRFRQAIPLTVFMSYLLIYSALNTLPIMMHLGWVEIRPIALFGTLTHTVMDGVVMFLMLQIRARAMREAQMQTTLELQRSQQRAEDEKRHSEEQSQLFAMLAHEMKTPLATLRMWMEAGELKPETMERSITDMNSVIERCVHTWQLADQGLQPHWQTMDPVDITRACIQSCRNPVQVDLLAAEATGALQTDAQMLTIVLGNLLDNACKYGAPQQRIQVELQRAQHNDRAGWLWQISNLVGTAGMPDPERLFEKYYRSSGARRLSGSGLGLFLVKGLLTLMQGTIRFDAQAAQVVFGIWLPEQPDAR